MTTSSSVPCVDSSRRSFIGTPGRHSSRLASQWPRESFMPPSKSVSWSHLVRSRVRVRVRIRVRVRVRVGVRVRVSWSHSSMKREARQRRSDASSASRMSW